MTDTADTERDKGRGETTVWMKPNRNNAIRKEKFVTTNRYATQRDNGKEIFATTYRYATQRENDEISATTNRCAALLEDENEKIATTYEYDSDKDTLHEYNPLSPPPNQSKHRAK